MFPCSVKPTCMSLDRSLESCKSALRTARSQGVYHCVCVSRWLVKFNFSPIRLERKVCKSIKCKAK